MPTRLYRGGEPNADMFRIIESNVRVSDVLGDIRAQYTSNMGVAKRLRELALAAGSHMFNPILGDLDPKTGQPYVCWELTMGGVGARSNKDGLEATSFPANASNVPIEVQESRRPVLFEHFGLIPDSAGAGEFRGGFGVRRDLRLTVDKTTMFNLGDRVKLRPSACLADKAGPLARRS